MKITAIHLVTTTLFRLHISLCYGITMGMAKSHDLSIAGFHEVDFVTSQSIKTVVFNSDNNKTAVSSSTSTSSFSNNFIPSQPQSSKNRLSILPFKSLSNAFKSTFLPSGYPASVPPEYLTFQIWNIIQDLCSYLRGIMATRAILEGFGVGRSDITSVQATLNWILRDGASMFGGLLFTTFSSANFGQNVKSWRLFADYINNVGITVDLLAPLSQRLFLPLICFSSVCKALCGISAGAAGSVISEHWGSQQGNIAEVNSKNGAQHTAISLLGLIVSIPFAKFSSQSPVIMWSVYSILTMIHMVANYIAMRTLQLRSINISRGTLLIKSYIDTIFDAFSQSHQPLSLSQQPPSIKSDSTNNIGDRNINTGTNNINNETIKSNSLSSLEQQLQAKLHQNAHLFTLKHIASTEPIFSLLAPPLPRFISLFSNRLFHSLQTLFRKFQGRSLQPIAKQPKSGVEIVYCNRRIQLWTAPSQIYQYLINRSGQFDDMILTNDDANKYIIIDGQKIKYNNNVNDQSKNNYNKSDKTLYICFDQAASSQDQLKGLLDAMIRVKQYENHKHTVFQSQQQLLHDPNINNNNLNTFTESKLVPPDMLNSLFQQFTQCLVRHNWDMSRILLRSRNARAYSYFN